VFLRAKLRGLTVLGLSMASQSEKAESFRAMHRRGRILLLPNAWDVPSARIFENMGFEAVATTSAGVSVSLGYPDGEKVPKDEMLHVLRKICSRVQLPVSADIESGFGRTKEEFIDTVRGVIEAGAVGVNVEDVADFDAKTLLPVQVQVERIRAAKRYAEDSGVPIVINARTDAIRFNVEGEQKSFEEAVRRCRLYLEAGADCVYPMGLTTAEAVSSFVKEVQAPVNIMARRGAPKVRELEKMGVARLSLGPGPIYASMGLLKKISKELLEVGSYDSMLELAITYDELNSLARPGV
jgi:2-methylisocitrate lyase-like PEP mutase family enzyme